MPTHTFTTPLWQWQARADSWYFVTIPPDFSDEMRELPLPPKGFGSIKVRVTIGGTTWLTSAFPDMQRSGSYVVPVKKSVRDAEGIGHDDSVTVTVEVV